VNKSQIRARTTNLKPRTAFRLLCPQLFSWRTSDCPQKFPLISWNRKHRIH